jgi:hypothetical protein
VCSSDLGAVPLLADHIEQAGHARAIESEQVHGGGGGHGEVSLGQRFSAS